jgi:hypothetical protein
MAIWQEVDVSAENPALFGGLIHTGNLEISYLFSGCLMGYDLQPHAPKF